MKLDWYFCPPPLFLAIPLQKKITEKNISNISNNAVQWQAVVVADGSTGLTATAGKGYFIDTTSGAQTVNLPSVDDSTLGDTIILKDFARQWGTNNVTMGSNTFDGVADVIGGLTGAYLRKIF